MKSTKAFKKNITKNSKIGLETSASMTDRSIFSEDLKQTDIKILILNIFKVNIPICSQPLVIVGVHIHHNNSFNLDSTWKSFRAEMDTFDLLGGGRIWKGGERDLDIFFYKCALNLKEMFW